MNDYTKFARLEGACNLSRNTRNPDRWSAEEWLKLYDCYKACDWDFSPDEWTERQVEEALKHGIIPEWDRYETPIYPDEPKRLANWTAPRVRFVKVQGIKYLRAEDAASYLREIAATEETDTRNRLNEAASNLEK